jgi:hypothetical protein
VRRPGRSGSAAIAALFGILFVIALILHFVFSASFDSVIGVTGWFAGVLALYLYLQDRFSTEPVILQIRFDHVDGKPNDYVIRVNISNEGGMKVSRCEVFLRGARIPETRLSRVLVEGPGGGAVRAEPPNDNITTFPLFPHRPVWATGYVTSEETVLLSLMLRIEGKELPSVQFHIGPVVHL